MYAVLAALGSALLLAIASVLQHRAGTHTSGATLRQVLRHPTWLVGSAAGVTGFALHVVALSAGSLSIVQPLLVTSLLFALPLGWVLEHRTIRVPELAAAAAVVAGLILFQLSARESTGRAAADLPRLAWCVVITMLVCAASLVAASRSREQRASWLGFCAGAAFGMLAALLKSAVGSLAGGPVAMLTSWPVYAFAVVVIGAIAVNQMAFNAGPLASSLPLVTIVDPVVAVAIGVVAFGETIASQPWLVTGQIAGFALMATGVVVLSRRPASRTCPQRSSPPSGYMVST